jgi:hypothetical protein
LVGKIKRNATRITMNKRTSRLLRRFAEAFNHTGNPALSPNAVRREYLRQPKTMRKAYKDAAAGMTGVQEGNGQ